MHLQQIGENSVGQQVPQEIPPAQGNYIGHRLHRLHEVVQQGPAVGGNGIPVGLAVQRKELNQRYLALKAEVKEAEQIRKSVYSILRQEQREQAPRRTQDVEL